MICNPLTKLYNEKMWIQILAIAFLYTQKCSGIHFIDLPNPDEEASPPQARRFMPRKSFPLTRNNPAGIQTKHWLFRQSDIVDDADAEEDEKDSNIKSKIATLVQQTVHDNDRKISSIQHLKDKNRDLPPYKIGFILSMIKKARDVLNELFNVAIKHREQWKALEQLKIFELIVHTNVDTTNLVRQLVELHIQHLSNSNTKTDKKRVVLL